MHILSLPREPGKILSGLEVTGDLGDYGKARQKTETVGMMGGKEYQGGRRLGFHDCRGHRKDKGKSGSMFPSFLGQLC